MSCWSELSRAERQVANYLKVGASNRSIAEALGLDIKTIKSHVHEILKALNCDNRTQAAIMLIRDEKGRS